MNERITFFRWSEIVEAALAGASFKPCTTTPSSRTTGSLPPLNSRLLYMGRRVVFQDNHVLLFDQCEYCGTCDLNERDICRNCGAPT